MVAAEWGGLGLLSQAHNQGRLVEVALGENTWHVNSMSKVEKGEVPMPSFTASVSGVQCQNRHTDAC